MSLNDFEVTKKLGRFCCYILQVMALTALCTRSNACRTTNSTHWRKLRWRNCRRRRRRMRLMKCAF